MAPPQRLPREIVADIGAARTCADVVQILASTEQQDTAVVYAAALSKLAKVAPKASSRGHIVHEREREGFATVAERARRHLHLHPEEWLPRQVSNGLWGIAKAKNILWVEGSGEVGRCVDALIDFANTKSVLAEFNPIELTMTAWSCAKRQTEGSVALLSSIVKGLPLQACRIQNFSGQSLSNILWAVATLSAGEACGARAVGNILNEICRRIQRKNAFSPQEIANIFWAMAKLQSGEAGGIVVHDAIVSGVVKSFSSNPLSFSPQNIANVAWAAATIGEGRDSDLLQQISARIARDDILSKFSNAELSMTAWAFATSDVTSGLGGDTLREVVLKSNRWRSLNMHQLAIITWSFAKLGQDSNGLSCLASAGVDKAASAGFRDLAMLSWGLARLGITDMALMNIISDTVMQLMQQESDARETRGDDGSKSWRQPRHLTMLIWAFAKLGVVDKKLAKCIAKEARRRAKEFSPRDLADCVWAYATLGIRRRKMLKRLGKVAASSLPHFNSQELLKFAGAYARIGGKNSAFDDAISEQRDLTYRFDAIGRNIRLVSQAPGFKFLRTGVSLWEASWVLAEWLSRASLSRSGDLEYATGIKVDDPSSEEGGNAKLEFSGGFGVELGAGLGLPTIIAASRGMNMVATDCDHDVLGLLERNVESNIVAGEGSVAVKHLRWGDHDDNILQHLGITDEPRLILCSDCVYGNKIASWRALVETLCALSGPETITLISNVRRFPVDHPKGEGVFFSLVDEHFERIEIPQRFLHTDYQRHGVGSTVISALRLRSTSTKTHKHHDKKRKRAS